MAGPPIALRLATRDDAPGIAALSRDRIEHGLGWRWTAPRVLRSVRDPATNVVVADAHGAALLGFGIMKYHDDEAHLLLLAVQAGAERRGIGRALMAWLEQSARVAGIGHVSLEARLVNASARAFYAGLGYRELQTVRGYYAGEDGHGGREDAVRLGKDLWEAPVAPT